jgi:hypothetical protein
MSAAKPRDYLVRSSKLRAWTAVDAASGSASAYREEEEEREGEEDEDEDDDDHSSPSSYRGSPPVIELPPPLDGSPRKATGRGKKAPKRKDVVADFEEELVAEYVELGLHEAARGERKTGDNDQGQSQSDSDGASGRTELWSQLIGHMTTWYVQGCVVVRWLAV